MQFITVITFLLILLSLAYSTTVTFLFNGTVIRAGSIVDHTTMTTIAVGIGEFVSGAMRLSKITPDTVSSNAGNFVPDMFLNMTAGNFTWLTVPTSVPTLVINSDSFTHGSSYQAPTPGGGTTSFFLDLFNPRTFPAASFPEYPGTGLFYIPGQDYNTGVITSGQGWLYDSTNGAGNRLEFALTSLVEIASNECFPGYYGHLCESCPICLNGGTCNDTFTGDGSCICRNNKFNATSLCANCFKGYFGNNCSSCPTCLNGGTCNDTITGDGICNCVNDNFNTTSFCSDCNVGHYGNLCNQCPICENNGTCNEGLIGNGSCICVHEGFNSTTRCTDCKRKFFGGNCEVCATCENSGTCVDSITGDGTCICTEGFTGNNCSIDPCDEIICSSRGSCIRASNGQSYSCECEDGYDGDDCENSMPDTTTEIVSTEVLTDNTIKESDIIISTEIVTLTEEQTTSPNSINTITDDTMINQGTFYILSISIMLLAMIV